MRGLQFVLKIILLCGATAYCASASGQSVDLALKNLHRQKWQRSHELLTKALAKDSLNVTAKYVLAQYFFSERNPAFQLDSAYRHVVGAQLDFQKMTLKQRDKLKRFPVDSLLLVGLRKQIDSVAFARTKLIHSEQAWIDFIQHFPLSYSLSHAIALRDSLGYESAVRENTYQSFEAFLQRYPHAVEARHARDKYEQLLLEDKTRDQTLASFLNFLSEYPNSPYRAKVEQTIFEYQTASGEPETFVEYIRSNPRNAFASKARNILFHLIPESERSFRWPTDFSNDSLSAVIDLEEDYLVPVLTKKKFGFMNPHGTEIIPAEADSLHPIYLCGNVNDDFLILPDKVIGRNGANIWRGHATHVEDLGLGFLVIEAKDCKFVIHKTGFQVGMDCITDAKILSSKFIAIEKDERWSVWTLSGRLLLQDVHSVSNVKNVIMLKREGKVSLITSSMLATLPLPPDYGGAHQYEEARSWNNELVFVRTGTHTGLLDQTLQAFVAPRDQIISPVFFGVVTADSSGYRIHSYAGQTSSTFQELIAREPWIAVKDSSWRFLDPETMKPHIHQSFDTINFYGPFAMAEKQDSSLIFFSAEHFLKVPPPSTVEFVPGKDSLAFLVVDHAGKKNVYNQQGKKIMSTTLDKIQYAGQNLFIVQKKEKKGLMTIGGNFLLPMEYDAIAPLENGVFSLLKSTKFGLFDSNRKKRIPPSYNKNLTLYTSNVITAFKDGLYGFVGWNNTPLSKFEFSEIQFWNDTTALVKKNFQWMLYEIKTKKVVINEIKDLSMIRNTASEKLAIIDQGVNYGVVHNRKGIVIPFTFTDIVNVGSSETPLYFTEKKVEEAPVFIVIYYDDQGKALRTEVYDSEEYDKIYCNNE